MLRIVVSSVKFQCQLDSKSHQLNEIEPFLATNIEEKY